MNRRQFRLTDEQFSNIAPHRSSDPHGKARRDDRQVVNASAAC